MTARPFAEDGVVHNQTIHGRDMFTHVGLRWGGHTWNLSVFDQGLLPAPLVAVLREIVRFTCAANKASSCPKRQKYVGLAQHWWHVLWNAGNEFLRSKGPV